MLSSKSPKDLQNSTPSSAISACSAEIIASNDDLLILILLRLPIKSLLKFKSVSKHWLSIVSDPLFCHRRTSLGRLTSSGLFFTRLNGEYDFINLTPYASRPPFESLSFGHQRAGILQSCNGLFLCEFYDLQLQDYYFVCNPTTKQYSRLPELQADGPIIDCIFLAFEPSKSSHYKVVCIGNSNSSCQNYHIDIYSYEGGQLRKSGAILPDHFDLGDFNGVYCNGAIHWITLDEIICFYFDVDEETFHELSGPEIPGGCSDRDVGYFGESGGRLLLMLIYQPEITQFYVYEMEEDRSGWFVKHRVDLQPLKLSFPEMANYDRDQWEHDFYGFSLLCIAEDEVEDGSSMILDIPGKLIRYKPKSKTWEVILETDERIGFYGCSFRWTGAHQYFESLYSV